MRHFMIAVMIAAASATAAQAHPDLGVEPPSCTETAQDFAQKFDMVGARLYPDQLIERTVASDRGDYLVMLTGSDAQDKLWATLRDAICAVPVVKPAEDPRRKPGLIEDVPEHQSSGLTWRVWHGGAWWYGGR